MNIVYLLLILGLFCNMSAANASSNDDTETLNVKNRPKRTKVKFTDLNPDVMYLILEQTSLIDTMNLLEAIPCQTISSVACSIYRRNFKDLQVQIYVDKLKNPKKTFKIDEKFQCLAIGTMDTILKVLKHFGSEIRSIYFRTQVFDRDKVDIISQHIGKYVHSSLEHFKLDQIHDNSFVYFRMPFERVEMLTYQVDNRTIKRHGSLPLNKIFPNLQILVLFVEHDVDLSFIQCQFPHLKSIFLIVEAYPQKKNDYVAAFLKENPQINILILQHIDHGYIETANQFLPSLKSVTLRAFDGGNKIIRMENVKHFVMDTTVPRSVHMLSMPQLQSLEINYSWKPHEWIEFLNNHTHLTRLHLRQCSPDDNVYWREFVANLTNLVELRVGFIKQFNINVEEIHSVFEDHPSLIKFMLTIPTANSKHLQMEFLDELRTKFENYERTLKWYILDFNTKTAKVLFERQSTQVEEVVN